METLAIPITVMPQKSASLDIDAHDYPVHSETEFLGKTNLNQQSSLPWQQVEIKKDDNLSMIFDRLGLGPTLLYQIMSSSKDTRLLKELMPGQKLNFLIKDGNLLSLKFEPNLTTALEIVKENSGFSSSIYITELELRTNESSGIINSSLFLAGQLV